MELEQISDTTKQVFWKLGRVAPPDPGASPRTKNSFRTALTDISQAAGQTLATAIGLGQLLVDDDGNPPDFGMAAKDWHDLGAGPDPDEEQDVIKQEIKQIFAGTEDEGDQFYHFTIKEYFDMVVKGGHPGQVVQEEREAYQRMLIGYEECSQLEIETGFERCDLRRSSVAHVTNQAIELGKIVDLETRLKERERMLFRAPSEDCVSVYLLTIIRNIEGYKAMEDWNGQSLEFRMGFLQRLARRQAPDEFEEVDDLDLSEKERKKMYKELTTPVRTKHSKMMEQRERFKELYMMFGPVALIDPTFMKLTPKGFPRMTKSSLDIYKAVIKKVEDKNLGQRRYANDRQFVIWALEELGGERVGKYIKDFLDKTCCWTL